MRNQADIEKQVREANKQQVHYDEQATEFGLSPRQREIARKKSQQLELRLAELNSELRQLSVVTLPSESGIIAAFGQMLAILDRIVTFGEKREFIEATLQRVLTDGRQVKVTGTLDVQAVANKGSKGGIYSIQNLDSLFGDQDVGRLEVAMRDALPMRGVQSLQNLARIVYSLFPRQWTCQRHALDELHHEVVGADVMQRADMRMIERRHGTSFPFKPFAEVGFRHFQRHGAIQASIARLPDFTHATLAQRRDQGIGTELVVRRKRHRRLE